MSVNHQVFTEPWSHKGPTDMFVSPQAIFENSEYSLASTARPVEHTQSPIVTGTSVLGIRYDRGVLLAADNLASYGSMARFRDIHRLLVVGKYTVVGVGGDISDLQYLQRLLDALTIQEQDAEDGHELRPEHVHEYLTRVMYNRRTKMNPLWNSIIVAGHSSAAASINQGSSQEAPGDKDGFLAFVDLLGTTYSSPVIATGMGAAIAIPLLRKATDGGAWKSLSKDAARSVLDECMKVLYYRDARSLNKFDVACVSTDGIEILSDQTVQTSWEFAREGYGYK